ncbi:GNAT superfamily N-acetyltransferase [Angulomicrobium tetraedrale]|uniref:GNAT superfamily N-acetyltransferase n=1 Tax=Ancylobacter tetraedralis TaxID=217068 RepID=A0A839ZC00_9HYPH|nr:GNAT family N-acetyltransferase [Ancylobacter tetraedralis]MBB3772237.1 GNAT superfamily N-acetyltransferase [Ancylobacter tetraedralis]
MLTIRSAESSDRQALASFLAQNFLSEPSMQAIFAIPGGLPPGALPLGALPPEALQVWFVAALSVWTSGAPNQAIIAQQDGSIVGAIILSGREKLSLAVAWGWFWTIGLGCGLKVVFRSLMAEWQRRGSWPTKKPIVIEFVAVLAEHRGRGIASQLFAEAHKQGTEFWLETTLDQNVVIFERLGYRVVSDHSALGCRHFAMMFSKS